MYPNIGKTKNQGRFSSRNKYLLLSMLMEINWLKIGEKKMLLNTYQYGHSFI
jgi:hypothetical protein